MPIQLSIPKGTPVGLISSLNIKDFVNGTLKEISAEVEGKNTVESAAILQKRVNSILGSKDKLLSTLSKYSSCTDLVENKGHTFGAELTDHDKTALIQYLKNF